MMSAGSPSAASSLTQRARRATALWIMASMLVAAALVEVIRPTERIGLERSATRLEHLVPPSFATWRLDRTGSNSIVNPQVQEVLLRLYSDTLARTYVDEDGRRIMLSIAYGMDQTDTTQVHRPEICYPAQGFTLESKANGVLDLGTISIEVRRLRTRLGARHEPVTYWIVVGDQIATRPTTKKRVELTYGLRGQIPDGLIFRVSSIGLDGLEEFKLHERFVRDLLRTMSLPGQQRMIGRALEAT